VVFVPQWQFFFSFRERIFRSDLVDSASLGREDPRRWERFFSFRDRIFRSVLVHSPSVGREVSQRREVIFRAGKYFFVPGNNFSFPFGAFAFCGKGSFATTGRNFSFRERIFRSVSVPSPAVAKGDSADGSQVGHERKKNLGKIGSFLILKKVDVAVAAGKVVVFFRACILASILVRMGDQDDAQCAPPQKKEEKKLTIPGHIFLE
jgi:hypothetical protein